MPKQATEIPDRPGFPKEDPQSRLDRDTQAEPYSEFDRILDELLEATGAEAAELFLREPVGDTLWLAAQRGIAAKEFQQRIEFKLGEGFPGLVAQHGEPIVTYNLPDDDRYLRSRVKARGFRYYHCAPVVVGDKVVGSLHIASRWQVEAASNDRSTLLRSASQLSDIIDLGRLRAKEVVSGLPADRDLDPKRNLERKLRHSLSAMVDFTGADGGIVLLRDPESGSLHPWCWQGDYESACAAVARADPQTCACSTITQRRCLMAPAKPGGAPKPCHHAPGGFARIACLPLIAEGRVLGAVSLGYRDREALPGRLLAVLGSMVDRTAIEVSDSLASVAAEQRAIVTRELSLLGDLDDILERSNSSREVAEVISAAREQGGEGLARTDSAAASTTAPFLDLRCFGKLAVFRDGQLVGPDRFRRRRAEKLLKILLTNYGTQLHKEELIELLWPAGPPHGAAKQLKVVVHDLRRVLQPDVPPRERTAFIQWTGEGYAFDTGSSHRLDSHDFVLLVKGGKRLERVGEQQAALAALQSAASLYTGDYLEEERYSDWCISEREFLRETYLSVLRRIASLLLEIGDAEGAIAAYRRALRTEGALEDAHRELMRLLWESGRRDDALRQYRICCDLLEHKTGGRPQPETERLYKRIRAA